MNKVMRSLGTLTGGGVASGVGANFDSRPVVMPIKKIVVETPTIRTFVFEYSKFSRSGGASKPGQFVMMWIPGVDEKPFSIAYDDGKEMWLTIANVGPGTKALFKLDVGDLVGLRGPFGTSYKFDKGERLALLAGGYGAAPMYNVACEALKLGCGVEFIVGARTAGLLLYEKRVAALAKKYPGKIKYLASTDDGSKGFHGYNTQILADVLGGVKGFGASRKKVSRVFACGPEIMMKKAAEMAVSAKVNCQLSLERYMKCGFGVCGQCCMDDSGICVCKSGPVYDGAAALKLSEFGKYHRDSVGRKV